MMHWGYGYGGWIGMLFGGLLLLLFLAGLIVLIVFVVRAYSRSSHTGERAESLPGPATSNRSLEILKERYAKGELTKEQYDEMRRDLHG